MIKIANTLLLCCPISNRVNQVAIDVVFRMIVVNCVIVMAVIAVVFVIPPLTKDPKDDATPLAIAIMFAAPPPTRDPKDDATPLAT
jgi:hypothetical protein